MVVTIIFGRGVLTAAWLQPQPKIRILEDVVDDGHITVGVSVDAPPSSYWSPCKSWSHRCTGRTKKSNKRSQKVPIEECCACPIDWNAIWAETISDHESTWTGGEFKLKSRSGPTGTGTAKSWHAARTAHLHIKLEEGGAIRKISVHQ